VLVFTRDCHVRERYIRRDFIASEQWYRICHLAFRFIYPLKMLLYARIMYSRHILRFQEYFVSLRVKLCSKLATWLHVYYRNICIVRKWKRVLYFRAPRHNGGTMKSLKVDLV